MHAKFKKKMQQVNVRTLKLHSEANREHEPSRVRELERDMDLDALGTFAVWRSGRNLYVIDGQHRKLALESLGLGDWVVDCEVYEGMDFQDACDMFLKRNKSRSVNTFEKFDKAVKAGYQAECETRKIVEKAGLTVSKSYGDGHLTCVVAATDVWKMDQGGIALGDALRIATGAWGQTAGAVEGPIVKGLGLIAHNYNGQLERDTLIKKLSKFPGGPGALRAVAAQQREFKGGSTAKNVAEVVRDLYNRGRRTHQLAPL